MNLDNKILHYLYMGYCRSFHKKFFRTTLSVQEQQEQVLMGIIKENSQTVFGKKMGFNNIKNIRDFQRQVTIHEYEDFQPYIDRIRGGEQNVLTREKVVRLVPSSGTSSASKLIPFNRSLQKDFSRAINIWLYDLYFHIPGLRTGKSFWIISPVNEGEEEEDKMPVEFAKDSSYFGKVGQYFLNQMMVLPDFISEVRDMDNYYYLLSWFLLKEAKLTLISLWNPSLFTIILEKILLHKGQLLDDISKGKLSTPRSLSSTLEKKISRYLKTDEERVEYLKRILEGGNDIYNINWVEVWPHLSLISCWTDSWAEKPFKGLKKLFPEVRFQGKGLLMTEGVVSIPLFDSEAEVSKTVLASSVHFFEFIDRQTGKVLLAHELQVGNEYEVVMTTSGGLYRYRTHDIIRFDGLFKGHPHISFIGKADVVSDIMGEKLHVSHVSRVLTKLGEQNGWEELICFLAPSISTDGVNYILFLEKNGDLETKEKERIIEHLDMALQENFHYKNCRNLSQLKKPGLLLMDESAIKKYNEQKFGGQQMSTGKSLFLEKSTEWAKLL
ncbi:MAG: hypothetical protein DWQ02_26850 [Bacteroidetes bacterium]|nr:MAG: hypothetical protein DWQ02_26850 [Bacteroidota bacterium]